MKYNFNLINGDIFNYIGKVDAVCITTNGVVKKNGELVMGAGVAKQFYDKYNNQFHIAKILADKIIENGNLVYMCVPAEQNSGTYVLSFPTKYHFQDKGDLELIKKSARRLVMLADQHNLMSIMLPSPGTGLGELNKEDVYKALNEILDKRFTIINYKK